MMQIFPAVWQAWVKFTLMMLLALHIGPMPLPKASSTTYR